ncbi:hypothetical protein CY34DRAFT_451316 [Suillus luteus UH-Slu-Lm8-n1]|uniref:Uncharacterized protein n=1 Tax=Suillus luteus UH-Slu-Lm8-n1 TaxID=930992 RepID=A0A0D0AHJ5_9AGAM|nr:hypothetical protein CY34DRAFT_451316 [Suillus luteus UH-Slu-Lm8-n1]
MRPSGLSASKMKAIKTLPSPFTESLAQTTSTIVSRFLLLKSKTRATEKQLHSMSTARLVL